MAYCKWTAPKYNAETTNFLKSSKMNSTYEILNLKEMAAIKGGLLIEHISYTPYPVSEKDINLEEEKKKVEKKKK